ncbi:hypothetical protein KC19_VG190400 [Ceratodon purpureus]|uniref:Uncharacterized protein n=1 Tax=Ceratodon purpureus TaxID=3225 RepID=A0A8T0HRG8_CERPU|nr:hypothetical protein KC19_VG190400 [Ceratodon purpureus]
MHFLTLRVKLRHQWQCKQRWKVLETVEGDCGPIVEPLFWEIQQEGFTPTSRSNSLLNRDCLEFRATASSVCEKQATGTTDTAR